MTRDRQPSLDDPGTASDARLDHVLQLLREVTDQAAGEARHRAETTIRLGQVETALAALGADLRQQSALQSAADAEVTARLQRMLLAQVAAEATTARLERDMAQLAELRDAIEAAATSSRRATVPQVAAAVVGALAASWHALSWVLQVLGPYL